MNDSRITQTRSLIEDAQAVLAGLAEEVVGNNNLEAARCFLKCSLQHLTILEGSCTTTM